jgi:hypothetical protein
MRNVPIAIRCGRLAVEVPWLRLRLLFRCPSRTTTTTTTTTTNGHLGGGPRFCRIAIHRWFDFSCTLPTVRSAVFFRRRDWSFVRSTGW